jgi:hypothetical protein
MHEIVTPNLFLSPSQSQRNQADRDQRQRMQQTDTPAAAKLNNLASDCSRANAFLHPCLLETKGTSQTLHCDCKNTLVRHTLPGSAER